MTILDRDLVERDRADRNPVESDLAESDPGPTATPRPPAICSPASDGMSWIDVCGIDDVTPGRGVCALVDHAQVAIFLLPSGDLFAIDNHDPFSGANVLSRGITGSHGDVPTVASPVFKHRFDLRTGHSLDDPQVRVPTWSTRVSGGRIAVATG